LSALNWSERHQVEQFLGMDPSRFPSRKYPGSRARQDWDAFTCRQRNSVAAAFFRIEEKSGNVGKLSIWLTTDSIIVVGIFSTSCCFIDS